MSEDDITRKVHHLLNTATPARTSAARRRAKIRGRARIPDPWKRAFAGACVALILQAAALVYAIHRNADVARERATRPLNLVFDPHARVVPIAPDASALEAPDAKRWREFEYRPDAAAGYYPQIRLRF